MVKKLEQSININMFAKLETIQNGTAFILTAKMNYTILYKYVSISWVQVLPLRRIYSDNSLIIHCNSCKPAKTNCSFFVLKI